MILRFSRVECIYTLPIFLQGIISRADTFPLMTPSDAFSRHYYKIDGFNALEPCKLGLCAPDRLVEFMPWIYWWWPYGD